MDVLIVTWQAGGGAQMALGLGRVTSARGHRVRLLAPRELAARVAAVACIHRPLPPSLEFDPSVDRRMEDQRAFLDRLFFGRDLPDALAAELEREPADVVVVDYLLRSAIAATEAVGATAALLIHTVYGFHGGATDPRWFAPVDESRAELGLEPLARRGDSVTVALVRRAAGALVALPRELDDWPEPPPNVVHVGPLTEEAGQDAWTPPWPPGDERPLVVVSLGTTYMNQEDEVARVVEALAPLGLRALVLTGHELDEREVPAAADVVVRRYVPHAAVLPHASLVVAHGGTGTLLASLAAAVPVLCLPLGRDQPANARRVEELGLGRVLARAAPPDAIRGAVSDLLASADVRARVAAFAETVRAYGDGERAVTALERLA